MSISDLLTQVEGKNRFRNGILILQVVKDGDTSNERYVGVAQAQDAIKRQSLKPGMLHAQTKWLVSTYKVPNLCERRVIPLTGL